jgi:uncharacterized phage protein (TIGR02218 family)
MTTFLEDEQSVEGSRPREGIELITGTGPIPTVYRIATGTRDITIDGNLYRASPAQRGEVTITAAANGTDLEIVLPLSHAVPQRYMQLGVPPRTIQVTVWRHQLTSGEDEVIWRGHVTSLAIEYPRARLLVPAVFTRILRRQVPTSTVGRLCPHVLYDKQCRVVKDDFKLETTVTYVNGRTIRCVEPYPDAFATYGEMKHVATGESVTIMNQTTTGVDGVERTLQLPIPGLAVGDAIEIYAGCAHSLAACRTKFDNVLNFGGFPFIKSALGWNSITQGVFEPV